MSFATADWLEASASSLREPSPLFPAACAARLKLIYYKNDELRVCLRVRSLIVVVICFRKIINSAEVHHWTKPVDVPACKVSGRLFPDTAPLTINFLSSRTSRATVSTDDRRTSWDPGAFQPSLRKMMEE